MGIRFVMAFFAVYPLPVNVTPSARTAPWLLRRTEIVPADPARVWRAITEPAELAQWWCTHAEVDLRPGGRYAFGGPQAFGVVASSAQAAPPEARHERLGDFEILRLRDGAELSFRWWLGDVETTVTYELAGVLEGTELCVTQTAAAPPFPSWPFSTSGGGAETPDWWWVHLPALRSYVEKGRADLRLDYEALRRTKEVVLSAPVCTFHWVIWRKLTSPIDLNHWWAEKAEVDLRPGGAFRLGSGEKGPGEVLEVDVERRLVHDWRWEGGTKSRVEWTIEETEEDTLVSLKDLGPWDPGALRERLYIHWGAVLLNLKQMSERGISPRGYQNA